MATAAFFQLVRHQGGLSPLPSTLSPSLTLESRRVQLEEDDGTCSLSGGYCLPNHCAPFSPQALLPLTWDLKHPCLEVFLPMFPASIQPHKLQALPAAWAAIKAGSSLLYSPPCGAAFQTMLLLCSCHGSAEITPLTPTASSPDHTKVTGLVLGTSILCSNALCLGKREIRELSSLVWEVPKQSPAEDHEDDGLKYLCGRFPNRVQQRTVKMMKGLKYL